MDRLESRPHHVENAPSHEKTARTRRTAFVGENWKTKRNPGCYSAVASGLGVLYTRAAYSWSRS